MGVQQNLCGLFSSWWQPPHHERIIRVWNFRLKGKTSYRISKLKVCQHYGLHPSKERAWSISKKYSTLNPNNNQSERHWYHWKEFVKWGRDWIRYWRIIQFFIASYCWRSYQIESTLTKKISRKHSEGNYHHQSHVQNRDQRRKGENEERRKFFVIEHQPIWRVKFGRS